MAVVATGNAPIIVVAVVAGATLRTSVAWWFSVFIRDGVTSTVTWCCGVCVCDVGGLGLSAGGGGESRSVFTERMTLGLGPLLATIVDDVAAWVSSVITESGLERVVVSLDSAAPTVLLLDAASALVGGVGVLGAEVGAAAGTCVAELSHILGEIGASKSGDDVLVSAMDSPSLLHLESTFLLFNLRS